jgi:hypothetical protein
MEVKIEALVDGCQGWSAGTGPTAAAALKAAMRLWDSKRMADVVIINGVYLGIASIKRFCI